MTRIFLIGLALALADGGGCGHDDGTAAPDAADDGAIVSCQMDARVEAYTANMAKTSKSGALTITLVQADPAPPARDNNTWTIKATDATGAAIDAAALTVTPFMPDHGHGTSVRAVLTSQGDGTIKVTPLYLFMPGVWRITFAAAVDGGGSADDQVQFFFCIAG